MRLIAIIIIMAGMGVLPHQEPIKHVFTQDYDREIYGQAHRYHGILSSSCPQYGEQYFMRGGERCNLITTIKRWEVVL